MRSIFITREIEPGSPLLQLSRDFILSGESLIEFKAIPVPGPITGDWLFFYSRNGVKFFKAIALAKNIDFSTFRVACMGKGTAKAFMDEFLIDPDFTGNGDPMDVSNQFINALSTHEKVIFIGANNSNHSVENIIGEKIDTSFIPVYDNSVKKDADIPACDIGIFTSPMNVRAFSNKRNIGQAGMLVAIGKVTALSLHRHGASEVIIAPDPSDSGLVKAIRIVTSE